MSQAYSIGTAKRGEPIKKDVPGPNQYLPIIMPKQNQPSWTIGGAQRGQRSSSIGPGPGQYNHKTQSVEGPCFSIAAKPASHKQESQSPGPGNYNDESFVSSQKRMPSYTMGFKHYSTTQKTDHQPGPGAYESNAIWLAGKMSKFTKDERNHQSKYETSPGPGQYDIIKAQKVTVETTQPAWSLGTGKRDDPTLKANKVPGPGQYTLQSMLANKQFTIKAKLMSQSSHMLVPGPGAYDNDESFIKTNAPAYKIGTQQRTLKSLISSLPGPGTYHREKMDILSSVQKSAPSFKMPQANRGSLNEHENTPGPGKYKIGSTLENAKITMKGSRNIGNTSMHQNPGPGQYDPDDSMVKSRAATYKIVGNYKSEHVAAYSPGPGQYALKTTLEGPNWGFGREARSQTMLSSLSPGPGSYNIPPKFADVPKYANCKPKYKF